MAYSKQTWDTTSYVNPTRMNHIEDGIYDADLTNHGITIPTATGTLALTSDITVQRYRAQAGTSVSSLKIPIKNDNSNILNGILFSRVWQDPNHATPMGGSIWWISIRPSNGTSGFKAILTDSSFTQTHISSVSYSTSEEMLTINFTSSATRFCEFIWG